MIDAVLSGLAKHAIVVGDARDVVRTMPDACVQTCVTSPPYFGLRDYGHAGQIGLEDTIADYVEALVSLFREVRRVLSDDGTLWLNLGDAYFGAGYTNHKINGEEWAAEQNGDKRRSRQQDLIRTNPDLKPKDLCGVPWTVALALRADGWYLRSDIIWSKPRPMPEPVTDRPTKAHEYVFLLTKSRRYFYDATAIRDRANEPGVRKVLAHSGTKAAHADPDRQRYLPRRERINPEFANARTVWTISPEAFPDAHFATMPTALASRCVRTGSRMGDIVFDPFSGAGTTGLVALEHARRYVGIELNPEYARMSERRLAGVAAQEFLPGVAV